MSDAERRVWSRLPEGAYAALNGMTTTDLQTLLLSVARGRASRVKPSDVLRRWREDRFVRPSGCQPSAMAALESRLWQLLPAEFEGIELSPLVPLGTCSALGAVSQNRIVTTARWSEVLSDSSNALAIEAADRRLRRAGGAVHLAASHRQMRAQRFPAGMSAHFKLFALVSTARDGGSGVVQARLLTLHLGYWRRVLATLVPSSMSQLHFTVIDDPVMRERITDSVLPALATMDRGDDGVTVIEEPDREQGRGYYVGAALRITVRHAGRVVDLGDGGFTTWTAQLMNDAKERCLVSCLSTERLLAVVAG
jgi:hypothetical protein